MALSPVPYSSDSRSHRSFGLASAGLVSGYAILTYVVLRPLHEAGFLQPVLAYLQGLDFLFQVPGLWLAQNLRLRVGHHTTLSAWSFSLACNAGLYYLL